MTKEGRFSLNYYKGTVYVEINNFVRDPEFKEKVLKENKKDPTINNILNIDN